MSRKSKPSKTATPQRRLRPDRPVAVLAALGLAITGYLASTAGGSDGPAFCGPGSGCDLVQDSRFSTLLGLPVALWGFLLYALIAWVAVTDPPRLKRWQRLAWLSALGLAVSIYLTAAGVVALDAICGWCTASLAVLAAIFGVVIWRRPASAPGMSWLMFNRNLTLVSAFVVLGLFALQTDLLLPPEDARLKALAIHLDESGARYYGAFWCPECQQQSRLFGRSADRLPYVECTPNGRGAGVAFECVAADVSAYPTWIIDGRRFQQVLTPDELSRYSGFRFRPERE
jgi:uncharacterized membrane protein